MMEHSLPWPALLCVLDFQGHFKQVNNTWQQLLGISVQHLLTTTFTHWLHPDDFISTEEALSQLRSAQVKQITFENRWRDPSGNYRWLLWRATNSSTEQLIYVAGLESTESKQSEQRYRAIVRGLYEGILLYETNGKISLCNPSAERLLGRSASQLIGQSEWNVVTVQEDGSPLPPEFHPVAVSLRTQEVRTEVVLGVIHKDEGLIWLSANCCPLRLCDTTEYDAVVLSIVNISERKLLEDELHDKTILLSSLFELAAIGMAILDEDGRFVRVNSAYCQVYGYQPHELIGQLFTILLPPPFRKEAFLHYTDFSSEKTTHFPLWSMQHRDGRVLDNQLCESRLILPDHRQFKVTYVIPKGESKSLEQEKETTSEIFPFQLWLPLLVKYLPITVLCLDRTGHVLFAEGQHLSLLGLEKEAQSVFAAHLGLDSLIIDLERVLNGENLSKVLVHKGVTFETHYMPLFQDNDCVGALAILKDISAEQKMFKTRLKNALQELELVTPSSSSVGMMYVEAQKIVRANQPCAELLGYTPVELLKISVEKLFFSASDFQQFIRHPVSPSSPYQGLHLLRKKNGHRLQCKLTIKNTHHSQRTLWLIESVLEHTLGGTNLQAALWATSNEPLLIIDAHLLIQQTNPASSYFTGYSSDELVGQPLSFLNAGWQDEAFYHQMIDTMTQTGLWQGEVWHRHKDHTLYVCHLKIQTYDITDKIKGYLAILSNKKTSTSAFLDPLTHLPTRMVFHYSLLKTHAAAQRYDKRFAVLLIGIDDLSTMNGQYGCKIGDQLLQTIGQTLRTSVRDSDTVARYDGDMFGVNLDEISMAQDAGLVAQMILFKLTQPFTFDEHKVQGSISIGIVVYPEDGNNVDNLLELAQMAMQKARQQGGNQCYFHNPQLGSF